MSLTKEAQEKWEQTLKEVELLEDGEVIEEYVKGDYWETLGGQSRGQYIFTNRKVIFVSGFGLKHVAIKYSDIKEIKKCMISMFIPTGIKLTAFDEKKGKNVKHKLSVMKRADWINFLSAKSGVSA